MNAFESVEFYKINKNGERVNLAFGYQTNYIYTNDKIYAIIVMKPGFKMNNPSAYLTIDHFTVETVGTGEYEHLVYRLDGFYLPEEPAYKSISYRFGATQLPKKTEPPKPPKEEVEKFTLNIGQMSGATNFSFTAYDPNDPTNVKTLTTKGGSIRDIPKGWMLKGEIEMQRNKYLDNTGSNEIKDTDLKMEIIDEGINNSYVKYSFDGYEVTSNLYLATSHVTAFNHVTYNLNGGTWTDTTLEAHPQLRWAENNGQLYQTFITPNQSVYKPTDPIRKGYKFIGWKSSSDIGKPNGSQSVHMDNYDFAEIDINTNADYVQGGIVSLVAQWEAQAPEFETETIEIVECEKFNKSDLIKGEINYNDDDVNKEKRSVEYSYPEDFDPKTPGEYKVLVTVKNGVGETTEKEAKVIVKRKWTPIEPTPILAVQDKTIKVGDDFRLTDLITDGGVDNVEITPPEGFDKNKPGVYDITFTKTAENGSKIIKTAKLTILPKDEEEPFVYEEKYRTEEAFEIEVEFDEKT